jgi:two-component system, OmpR family, phosphate regulon sensor histidine kinase PhoR
METSNSPDRPGASCRDPAEGRASDDPCLTQLRQLSTIFDALNAVVYVADMETYELLFLNAYSQGLFGPEGQGHPCFRVLQAGQTSPCAFCTNDRLVRDGRPQPPYVWEFQNTVTGRWFQCIDRAIEWTDGRLVRMEIAVDITERKGTEEFRERYLQTISHDLRTPLTIISSHAQLLRRRLQQRDLGAFEGRCLDAILSGASRMNTMIRDLVDSARLEGGHLQLRTEAVALGPFLAELLERVASVLDVQRLHVDATPDLPPAHVDPERLERILLNLLSNALTYSAAGSPVRVTASSGSDGVVVSVADQGRGIAPDDLPHIFERFYRGTGGHTGEGVGLGLYITRMLVEAHGGRIWVDSRPAQGTTFSFTLPVA